MTTANDLRLALLQANPRLSKFNPLPRILFHDDFDEGVHGWAELIGNHDGNLDNVRRTMADLRPPQLSTCTFFDIGTHGSMEGTYSLKMATRPQALHMAQAIKRVTFVKLGLVQFETYFTYKAEQLFGVGSAGGRAWDGNYDPSEANFGEFTISNDVNEGPDGRRYHIALRYMNTDFEGNLVQKWMYKTSVMPSTKMVNFGDWPETIDYHVKHPDDWEEVPGGHQLLAYNEVPTKVNWHYLRWLFDTRTRRSVELQCNDLVLDLRQIPVPMYDHPYHGCKQLLNFCADVRTHLPVRNFLYLDSVLVSVDW